MKSVMSTPTGKECESLVVQTHSKILRRVNISTRHKRNTHIDFLITLICLKGDISLFFIFNFFHQDYKTHACKNSFIQCKKIIVYYVLFLTFLLDNSFWRPYRILNRPEKSTKVNIPYALCADQISIIIFILLRLFVLYIPYVRS